MNSLLEYIGGRSVGILGLGVSNLPLAEHLAQRGIRLTVRDKKTPAELGERAEALAASGVGFVSGKDCFFGICEELIFRSPGIRPDIEGIERALSGGAALTSEIELLLRFSEAESFCVTGSDGKTTTTTLVGKFFEADGRDTFVGGNIGRPLLVEYEKMKPGDALVLELSSFQTMTLGKCPENIAITNITPNHLDWHRGFEEYVEAKKKIIGKETQRVVFNFDNELTRAIAAEAAEGGREVILFSSTADAKEMLAACPVASLAVYRKNDKIVIFNGKSEEELLDIGSIKLPGVHNIENFMTAMALTYGKVKKEVYSSVAESFFGVEHRLEWVRELGGVDFYNSSIDSSPTRTAAALSALSGRDIVIICGGYDKKIPYEPLAKALGAHARAVVLTGATRDKIRAAIESTSDCDGLEVAIEPDFGAAVNKAYSMAREGGCVLLSPASASFDAFRNFAERGKFFKEIVQSLDIK